SLNELLPNTVINWTTSNAQIVGLAATSNTNATITGRTLGTATVTATTTNGVTVAVPVTVDAGPYLVYETFNASGSLGGRTPDVSVTSHTWTMSGTGATPTLDGSRAYFSTCCNGTNATVDSGSSDVTIMADWTSPSSS